MISLLTSRLRLCPFCGDEPRLDHLRADGVAGPDAWASRVSCTGPDCGASITRNGTTKGRADRRAARSWNRRPPNNGGKR